MPGGLVTGTRVDDDCLLAGIGEPEVEAEGGGIGDWVGVDVGDIQPVTTIKNGGTAVGVEAIIALSADQCVVMIRTIQFIIAGPAGEVEPLNGFVVNRLK